MVIWVYDLNERNALLKYWNTYLKVGHGEIEFLCESHFWDDKCLQQRADQDGTRIDHRVVRFLCEQHEQTWHCISVCVYDQLNTAYKENP
jgi:hypothetical protein